MRSAQLLSLVGLAGFALAKTCEDIEIKEISQNIDCDDDIVEGDITIDSDLAGHLIIDGPKIVEGDIIIKNATGLLSITSTTITTIKGSLELLEVNGLTALNFGKLESINSLTMEKVPQLGEMTFGTDGVTEASTVSIINTKLDNLNGLMFTKVDTLRIVSNDRMKEYESNLVNITDLLEIRNNGRDMAIDLKDLEEAGNVEIRGVKSLNIPALEKVGVLSIENTTDFETFFAPNLTEAAASVTLRYNEMLSNISMPVLEKISGDLSIFNNTELNDLSLPALESVETIRLGGNFSSVELPELKNVLGSLSITSTTDIRDFCGFVDDLDVEGESQCTSENPDAVSGNPDGGDDSTDGGSNSDEDDDSAAGIMNINFAVLGLTAVAGLAQLL